MGVKLEPIASLVIQQSNGNHGEELLLPATTLNRQDSGMNDSSSNAGGTTISQRPFVEHPIKEMRALSQIQFKKGAAVASVEDVMVRYPLPPKKGAKKVEEKKKKDEPPPEPKVPETLSIAKAHSMA